MTCNEFRRLAYAQNETRDPAAVGHAATCEACRRLAETLRRQDEALGRALAVVAPTGLADRVLLARQIRRPRIRVMAVAASAAMIAFVGALAFWQVHVTRSLAGEMIAHVVAEPRSLAAAENLPRERLAAALARAGFSTKIPLGEVRYAGQCEMPGGIGEHLVVETPRGKVTIIVTPLGHNALIRQRVARAGYYAEVLPGHGSAVGVVGPDAEAIRSVAAMIEKA